MKKDFKNPTKKQFPQSYKESYFLSDLMNSKNHQLFAYSANSCQNAFKRESAN